MDRKSDALLVDFDDTLFFTGGALPLATKDVLGKRMARDEIRRLDRKTKHRIYEVAQTKYTGMSVPNRLMIWKLRRVKNAEIVVMTARSAKLRGYTVRLLKKHNIRFDRLLMRDRKALLLRDEEWKLREIMKFLKAYANVSYYDDKIENISYAKARVAKRAGFGMFLVKPNKIIKQ
ncbi:MAG: hypothetical protein KGI04_01680 [Candidatus Micrarchaeota archaeon]|nr:hypothetical protein [Candidatus Micrarchaeota archaeon]